MLGRNSSARLPAVLLLLSAPAVFGADEKPVAHVGNEVVTARALSRRLAKIPDFQRAALADDPSGLKRRVLDTLLVPDLLFAQEAERLNLAQRGSVQAQVREILRAAMDRDLRREADAATPVTAADIKGYFAANSARFQTPRRIHIWRILSDDESLAKKILSDVNGVDGIQRWSKYARENSLDAATHLRSGDLGFVHPDGDTDTPTLRVDPALFAAADLLTDGELAREPIKEGPRWAVIWRRGSMKAVSRTLDQEQGSIRQVLERQRVEQARETLLVRLRAKYVSQVDEAALEKLHFDGDGLPSRQIINVAPHAAAAGSSIPDPR
jgi:peptidyl-prolyl cis-trans isomerase C